MKIKIIPVATHEPMRIEDLKVENGDKYTALVNKLHELQGGPQPMLQQVRLGRYPATHTFTLGTQVQKQKVPGDGKLLMLVDENGRLKSLDFNIRASMLYGFTDHGSPIVGPAMLITETEVDSGEGYMEADWGDYDMKLEEV